MRDGERAETGTGTARGALDFIVAHEGAAIFHLKDFHEPLRESPEVRRRLRDVYESCRDQGKYVVDHVARAAPFRKNWSAAFCFSNCVRPIWSNWWSFCGRSPTAPRDAERGASLHQIARALQGLTLDEARYALRRALAASPQSGPEALPALLEEKRLLVNRSGVIEYHFRRHRLWARSEVSRASRNGCWSGASYFRCATA